MTPLRRVLLGQGRLPDELRAALMAEDLLLLDEELTGSITYRNYRAPGRRSSYRKEAISGAIAVTAQRLVVWGARSKQIDVPLNHPLRGAVEVSTEPGDRILFGYDAAAFDTARSGRVELRLRTAQAARIAELLAPTT